MRHSRQRDEILSIVRSRRLDHPTAQQVHDAVRAVMPELSLGTVYRNLHQLVEAGQLSAVETGGALHYDWDLKPHHHLHCKACGVLVDLPLDLAGTVREQAQALGHDVDDFDLRLRGLCARCAAHSQTH
jgi:Fur family transcriptional regulator, peroxide stress response regulator